MVGQSTYARRNRHSFAEAQLLRIVPIQLSRHTREGKVSSTPRRFDSIIDASECWIARSSRAMTTESSSLRGAQRRSNPVFLAALDCFASLAMTWRHTFSFSRHHLPEL
jgi:hypothetical protein